MKKLKNDRAKRDRYASITDSNSKIAEAWQEKQS